MSKMLITFDENWADEFDCQGFQLLEEEEWKRTVAEIMASEHNFPIEVYFGTNQCFDFDTPEEFLKAFKTETITDSAAEMLKDLFNLGDNYFGSFGICPLEACEGNASEEFYEKYPPHDKVGDVYTRVSKD